MCLLRVSPFTSLGNKSIRTFPKTLKWWADCSACTFVSGMQNFVQGFQSKGWNFLGDYLYRGTSNLGCNHYFNLAMAQDDAGRLSLRPRHCWAFRLLDLRMCLVISVLDILAVLGWGPRTRSCVIVFDVCMPFTKWWLLNLGRTAQRPFGFVKWRH